MVKRIKVDNGAILEFPDDADDDEIESGVNEYLSETEGTTPAPITEIPAAPRPVPVAQSDSFLSDMALGAKKRALGIGQIGMEVLGRTDTDTYKDMQEIAARYKQQGEGTGVRGGAGEMLGDPLTAAMLPFGAGATGIKALAMLGAGGGAAMGATNPLQEGQSRLAEIGINTVGGAILSPVAGKGMQAIGRGVEKLGINPAVNAYREVNNAIEANILGQQTFAPQQIATVQELLKIFGTNMQNQSSTEPSSLARAGSLADIIISGAGQFKNQGN